MQKLPTLLVVSGFILLVGTIAIGWIVFPKALESKILEKLRLQNGSDTWENWKNVPIPIYFKVYLFNVTNPDEVEAGGRPDLDELGPFVYEEKRYKTVISIDEENDTVKYTQQVFYYFREDLSHGTENDKMTVLNIPYIAISNIGFTLPAAAQVLMNFYFLRFKETLFVQRTVKQMLFEGYYSQLAKELKGVIGKEILPDNKFGLFYGKNGSDDGEYEVYSGIRSPSDFGRISAWNGQSSLTWWGGKFCNMINGSDGSLFPGFVQKDRILYIFNPDLCRSLHLKFDRETDFMGIRSYRFTVPVELLQDPQTNRDNMCFCPNPGIKYDGCPKGGAIQLSHCRKGAPIVASTVHFLDGDLEYISSSKGINPIRSNHETYIDLEPMTGLVVQASKRVQVNIDLKPSKTFDKLEKVRKMIFPVMWADEYAGLTEEKVRDLETKLFLPITIVHVGRFVLLGISFFLVFIGLWLFILRARKKKMFV